MNPPDHESPWDRPTNPIYARGPMKVETRFPVIGRGKLVELLEELLADNVPMQDIQIVLVGAAPGGKIVTGPKGAPAVPEPVLLVCWAKETVRT
jgi:hypothetical protein